MDISTRHNPGFAVARCTLAGGESFRAEAGAMMATSEDVDVDAKMEGGLMKGLKRSVMGGESMFIAKFTAPPAGGWVEIAAVLPGDVTVADVSGELFIQRGSYLGSEEGVEIDAKWGGFKNLFGGEGGFLVRASGRGQVVVAAYGALDTYELGEGQSMVVDSGHMVAYDPSVTVDLRRAGGGNLKALKSGEGFVFHFLGPGRVMTQTRNQNALIGWLTTALPFTRS